MVMFYVFKKVFFFFLAGIPVLYFIHSSIFGHLGSFQYFAATNSAAMNNLVYRHCYRVGGNL